MSELNDKQRLFCLEYIKDFNATQAAIRAGYSKKTAGQQAFDLLKKLEIQEEITKAKNERMEAVKIDANWVLKQAVSVHQRCMQAEAVTDRSGEPVKDFDGKVIYKFDSSGANKALEIVGKHIDVQAFNEKSTSETTVKLDKPLAERLTGGSKK